MQKKATTSQPTGSALNPFADRIQAVVELLGIPTDLRGLPFRADQRRELAKGYIKKGKCRDLATKLHAALLEKAMAARIKSDTGTTSNQAAIRKLGSSEEFVALAMSVAVLPEVRTAPVTSTSSIQPKFADTPPPVPPFRLLNYNELLVLGLTQDQIWEASDWIDLAIAEAEGNPMFDERHWIEQETGQKIASRDVASMLLLVDSTHKIWGYSLITALLPQYFELALHGGYYEPDLRVEHTLPIVPFSELDIFVWGVDIHPLLWIDGGSVNSLATFQMMRWLLDFGSKLCAAQNYRVKRIAAFGVTEKGRRLCEIAGMIKIRSFVRDGVANDVYLNIPVPG